MRPQVHPVFRAPGARGAGLTTPTASSSGTGPELSARSPREHCAVRAHGRLRAREQRQPRRQGDPPECGEERSRAAALAPAETELDPQNWAGRPWEVQKATPRGVRFPRRKRRSSRVLRVRLTISTYIYLTTCRIKCFNINSIVPLLLKRYPLPTVLHNFLRELYLHMMLQIDIKRYENYKENCIFNRGKSLFHILRKKEKTLLCEIMFFFRLRPFLGSAVGCYDVFDVSWPTRTTCYLV